MFNEPGAKQNKKGHPFPDYSVKGFKIHEQKLFIYSKKHIANFNIKRIKVASKASK
jgi:hypothetical protein